MKVMKNKNVKITYSEEIEKAKFDYKEFIKGIELPENSEWKATIIK